MQTNACIFREGKYNATALAVDGKTTLPSIPAVRAEIYTPQDPSNQRATDLTKEHIKVFAAGMLHTLLDCFFGRQTFELDLEREGQSNRTVRVTNCTVTARDAEQLFQVGAWVSRPDCS